MSALPVPSRLEALEDVIARGLETFVEVGQALREIRDSGLFPQRTFDDYCRERWGMDRVHAHRHIQAAEVAGLLSIDNADAPRPANVAVTRELVPLRAEPKSLREAWAETVERHGPTPTAAEVREVVQTRGQLANQSGGTDEWSTPQDFYDVVDSEFGFTLDACALESSAKCAHYFTPETDGLSKAWTGTVWMNPPYGDVIGAWVQKAAESAAAGATVVCLVPARTDTAWFHDYCLPGEVRLIRGRLRFGAAEASAPFPSCLVVLGPDVEQRAYGWDWR